MAARNRPRAGQIKNDADEEMSIWNQLRSDAKRVDVLVVRICQLSMCPAFFAVHLPLMTFCLERKLTGTSFSGIEGM